MMIPSFSDDEPYRTEKPFGGFRVEIAHRAPINLTIHQTKSPTHRVVFVLLRPSVGLATKTLVVALLNQDGHRVCCAEP